MAIRGAEMEVLDRADTIDDAVEKMAQAVIAFGPRLNAAVGLGDRTGEALTDALATSLASAPNVLEVMRYRIGPSIGAYIGAGTVACFAFPAD
jgi:fatty acid-binding protein DegV